MSQSARELDPSALARLAEIDDDWRQSLLPDLAKIFRDQNEELLGTAPALLSAGDHAELRRLAHKIRSSCANLGLNLLASQLEHLEKLPDNAAAADFATAFHAYARGVPDGLAALDAALGVPPASDGQ